MRLVNALCWAKVLTRIRAYRPKERTKQCSFSLRAANLTAASHAMT